MATAITVAFAGCGDDGFEPPVREDCGTACEDEDTAAGGAVEPEPEACGGPCRDGEACVDDVCESVAPALPACAGLVRFEPLDVEIPLAARDQAATRIVAADLGLGEGDDLLFIGEERVFVVPSDPLLSPSELLQLPSIRIGPEVGDVSGDGVPDLVFTSETRAEVYVGDGQGGFAPGHTVELGGDSVESVASPLLVGDIDADGDADLIFTVDDSLLWVANEGGVLADVQELGEFAVGVDLRVDETGTPELWAGALSLWAYRAPELVPERLELPFAPGDFLLPEFGRYTGEADAEALVFTSRIDGTFVVFGERPDALHMALAAGVNGEVKSGDLDGDGLDDLLLGRQHAVLGLAEGTPDEPFSVACIADVVGLPGLRPTFARWLPGEPEQVIGWSGGLDAVPRVYVAQTSP